MKRVLFILIECVCLSAFAQTPYDSFAPETSRPILGIEALSRTHTSSVQSPDSLFCAFVIDTSQEQVYLMDVSDGKIIAYAPITDDIRKWMSVDPRADKYPNASPYLYCGGNPLTRIDNDGQNWEEEFGHWDIDLTSPTCGQYIKGDIKWTDKNSQLEVGTEGIYLGTDVLVGTHNRDENLNEAPNTAQFDLYLSSNKEGPVATIMGNTIPADVNTMGTLKEGLYPAEYKMYKHNMPAILINGGRPLPTVKGGSANNPLNHIGNNKDNPMKPISEQVLTGVYFHYGNNFGTALRGNNGVDWSTGCQTGGNYKGSHSDYLNFMQNVPTTFKGSYYLRGK